MMRVLSVLLGFWCVSIMANTTTNQELLQNLSKRIHSLPHQEGALIKSFTNHSQSYIYDQALAIITFSKAHELNKARSLLLGLKSLQMKDGSLYFSYYLDGKSPYPTEGDKRFAGAIAWVAIAASHYQKEFKSEEFVSFNKKILDHLHSEIVPVKINGEHLKAVKFAPKDIEASAWNESETVALEHNLDAYAAFKLFSKINKTSDWDEEISSLKKFAMSMWDKDVNHFWSGANVKTGLINKDEIYLDNQSWSLLAFENENLKAIEPKLALEFNCKKLMVSHAKVTGFMDSKPTRRPAASQFVWSEGTLGQVLAMKRIESNCDHSADYFIKSIHGMKKEDGGIAYSTPTSNPDFTTASSVAGTTWLYFAINDINPFQS